MSNKERLQLELECLLKYSKEEMIEKYIDKFEENAKLSDLWCKNQQENKQLKEENKQLKEQKKQAREYIKNCTMGGDNVYVDNIDIEELLKILGADE